MTSAAGVRAADQHAGQLPGGGIGQRAQLDRPHARRAGQLVDLGAGVGPGGGQDEQRPPGREGDQLGGEPQRRRVGPVQVLKHDDRGPPGRDEPGDDGAQRGEGDPAQFLRPHLLAMLRAAGRRDQAHDVLEHRQQLGAGQQRAQRPLQRGADHRARLVRRDAGPAGQQLLVQAIGGGRGVGRAAAFQPQRQPAVAGADPGHEPVAALLDEPGLAQARLPAQHDDAAVAGYRLAQRGIQDGQLRAATHDRAAGAEPQLAAGRQRRAQVAGRLLVRAPAEQVPGRGAGLAGRRARCPAGPATEAPPRPRRPRRAPRTRPWRRRRSRRRRQGRSRRRCVASPGAAAAAGAGRRGAGAWPPPGAATAARAR